MAQRISWVSPSELTVTKVEISRSDTIYGTYAILNEINATSDGAAKTAANTWVTTYTDSTGTRTHWYKIRLYDGTSLTYSEYSDPITSYQQVNLCSLDDVKNVIDTVGRFTDDDIYTAIQDAEDSIYIELGTPILASKSGVGKIDTTLQDTYYVGEENIYRIDRLLYGTSTMTEYFIDDGFKSNVKYGMIRLLPVASGGPTLDEECDVEIHYVPKVYNRIATYRAAKFLLERINYLIGGKSNTELDIIKSRLEMYEQQHVDRMGIKFSSDYANYDSVYGVNLRSINQNHSRNNYLARYGW